MYATKFFPLLPIVLLFSMVDVSLTFPHMFLPLFTMNSMCRRYKSPPLDIFANDVDLNNVGFVIVAFVLNNGN